MTRRDVGTRAAFLSRRSSVVANTSAPPASADARCRASSSPIPTILPYGGPLFEGKIMWHIDRRKGERPGGEVPPLKIRISAVLKPQGGGRDEGVVAAEA